jgi:hypothetical protein
LPQRPQLFVSVEVLTQRLLQYVWPVGQPQTPARQSWPVGHTLPHDPQLAVSLLVLTQRAVAVQ